MKNRLDHIAKLLLLVFAIPMVYQSWHNVSHHLHEVSVVFLTQTCNSNHGSLMSCSHENSDGYSASTPKNTCVVKDYEFSIKDLPTLCCNQHSEFLQNNHRTYFLLQGYSNYNRSVKASRAPPFQG